MNNELKNLLVKILSLQSHAPQRSRVPEVITSYLNSKGVRTEVIELGGIKNIVAKTSENINLVLNGHWDTVLPDESFNKDILNVKQDDSNIGGLGACDMKSGVISEIGAFIRCYQEKIDGVCLSLVGDEERGGNNGTKVLTEKGLVGKYVILAEPTNMTASLGQKGGIFLTVISTGKTGHSAYPHRGENAIMKTLDFISKLNLKYPLPKPGASDEEVFELITASVNMINSGTSPNVIPADAVTKIDMRLPPSTVVEDVFDSINQLADSCHVKIDYQYLGEGWKLDTNSKLFSLANQAFFDTRKENLKYVRKMGTNDGKYYAKFGCEIINIGPGDNKLSHTANETVDFKSVIEASNIYYLIAKSL